MTSKDMTGRDSVPSPIEGWRSDDGLLAVREDGHTFVVGSTRQGKSVVTLDVLAQLLRQQGTGTPPASTGAVGPICPIGPTGPNRSAR